MNHQRAFTLVELSIVLVILGLLIGGVLTGQTLIRAAELRSITTQQARFVTATQTFRDKYFALPGDMANATAYWGVQDATPATCATTASTDSKTCNGNGDGNIINTSGANEIFRYWQHLANAGLIEGTYDGITHGTISTSATAANSPSGRLSGSIWIIINWGTQLNSSYLFDGVYDHMYQFGLPALNGTPNGALMKPEEVYNIDVKVDDGKPATGKVLPRQPSSFNGCTDATTSNMLSANYLLSNTAVTCAIIFRQQF